MLTYTLTHNAIVIGICHICKRSGRLDSVNKYIINLHHLNSGVVLKVTNCLEGVC